MFSPSTTIIATDGGSYQAGYVDGTAFTALKKTNANARLHSTAVGQGDERPTVYGIKSPSSIATQFGDFDIVYGHMIEFFHNLQIVSRHLFLF